MGSVSFSLFFIEGLMKVETWFHNVAQIDFSLRILCILGPRIKSIYQHYQLKYVFFVTVLVGLGFLKFVYFIF